MIDSFKVPAGKMVVSVRGQTTLRDIDTEKSKDAKDGRGHPRSVPVLDHGEDVAYTVNGPPQIIPKGYRV